MNTKPSKPKVPQCPVCDTAEDVKQLGARCVCHRCGGIFEPDDEGGDYSSRNPAARLERQEREEQRRSNQQQRRQR